MSKHKVTRYDDGGDVDEMEEANKGENLDTTPAPAAQRAPIVTKEELAKSGLSLRDYMNKQQGLTRRGGGTPAASGSTDDRSKRPSLRGTTDMESRDRFGIPTSMGSAGKSYAPTGKAAESASGSELMRNLGAAGSATGASAAIQGVRRGAAVGKGLSEFAAGRAGAKEAPAAVSAARGAMDRAMSAERAAPKTGDMAKINDALKAFKSKPAAKSAPKPKPKRMTEAERDAIGRADTLDEFGGAMKRGGSVKGYAKGGSISSASSRADGIAQRGKTRGTMFCGGGMTKGKR